MADKYYRLVSLLINICPEPLQDLFLAQAKADIGSAYSTLDSYLAFKRPQIAQLIQRRVLRQDQFDLLFPSSGLAEISQWDISLLYLLIKEFFGKKLQNQNGIMFYMGEIRDVRNILQHTSSTSKMTDSTFDNTWKRLETATLFLANQHGSVYENKIKQKINEAKVRNMPDLGNTLCSWFEDRIPCVQNNIEEISEDTKDTQANAKESIAILRSATVSKQGPSGEKVKRIKTVDIKLKKMQDNFEMTMNTEIPDNFDAPSEVDSIKMKLRDKHLVIVAGHHNSHYLATALSAIKEMGYNEKRCMEMQSSTDWSHVDPEDVEFVLCCNPFGKEFYDEEKAKGMVDILPSIQHTVKEVGNGHKFDVLITTDIGVLDECKAKYYHDIFDEVITVYPSTSETQPADLTLGRCTYNYVPSVLGFTAGTLIGQTEIFLNHYMISSKQVDPGILKRAKEKFKAHKAVVLVGAAGCGKTAMAVALAASYHPSRVLLLSYPEQVQHVDHNRTHLVIIEDFAGKYGFNETQICDWYRTFDHLNFMKSAGKLNIIITCDKQKLEKCLEEIAMHPLLQYSVDLNSPHLVKQEITYTDESNDNDRKTVSDDSDRDTMSDGSDRETVSDDNDRETVSDDNDREIVSDDSDRESVETTSTGTEPSGSDRETPMLSRSPWFTSVASVNGCFNAGRIVGDTLIKCTSMCLTKDGSLCVAAETIIYKGINGPDHYLLYLDRNRNKTAKYNVEKRINKMCCPYTDVIVVLNRDSRTPCLSVWGISFGLLVPIKTLKYRERVQCCTMSCDDEGNTYILWSDGLVEVYMYILNSEIKEMYKTSEVTSPFLDAILSPQGHIFITTATHLLYENFRSIQVAKVYHLDKNISICRGTEEPFTVFKQKKGYIYLYNTKLQQISLIPLPSQCLYGSHMVFDESNSRLIMYQDSSSMVYELYLK